MSGSAASTSTTFVRLAAPVSSATHAGVCRAGPNPDRDAHAIRMPASAVDALLAVVMLPVVTLLSGTGLSGTGLTGTG